MLFTYASLQAGEKMNVRKRQVTEVYEVVQNLSQ